MRVPVSTGRVEAKHLCADCRSAPTQVVFPMSSTVMHIPTQDPEPCRVVVLSWPCIELKKPLWNSIFWGSATACFLASLRRAIRHFGLKLLDCLDFPGGRSSQHATSFEGASPEGVEVIRLRRNCGRGCSMRPGCRLTLNLLL